MAEDENTARKCIRSIWRGLYKYTETAEVGDEHMVVHAEHDVLRLQIAVSNAFGMRGIEGGAELSRNVQRAVEGERPLATKQLVEILAALPGRRSSRYLGPKSTQPASARREPVARRMSMRTMRVLRRTRWGIVHNRCRVRARQ